MMIQIIINPESGRWTGRSLENEIREKFSGLSFDLQCTSGPGHATHLARAASADGVRTVVAVGGDGIVNEVLNGIAGTGTTLGIIPAGTANDLARHLGISGNITASRDLICGGCSTVLDTIYVNGRCFLTTGGIGLACEIAQTAGKLRSGGTGKFGRWVFSGGKLYLLAALTALATRENDVRPVCVQIDGRWIVVDPLWITVSNQPRVGRYFLVSPDARNDDGYFNICIARNTPNRLKTLSTVISTFTGRHENLEGVSAFRSQEMIIQASEPVPFFGDGELLCESDELRVRIRPSSVRILVPVSRCRVASHEHGITDKERPFNGGRYESNA